MYRGGSRIFKSGEAHLQKLRRAEGGLKMFGVFRVKNRDFTPKNHFFSNCGGRRENCWGISCVKLRFYSNKSSVLQFWPPLDPPLMYMFFVEQYILAIVFVLLYDRYIFSVERAFIKCEKKGWL